MSVYLHYIILHLLYDLSVQGMHPKILIYDEQD